ncbi:MAG: hypothetical protein VB108_01405 [Anaerolineaceae bacterium]|nr:hypothetical protein [Anaerolineaceae bacterium]
MSRQWDGQSIWPFVVWGFSQDDCQTLHCVQGDAFKDGGSPPTMQMQLPCYTAGRVMER